MRKFGSTLFSLSDIFANILSFIILILVILLLQKSSKDETTESQWREFTQIMSREILRDLVQKDFPSSKKAILHEYGKCYLPTKNEENLPIISMYKKVIVIEDTGQTLNREALGRQNNDLDNYLDNLHRNTIIRVDFHDVALFYDLYPIFHDHGIQIRHTHFCSSQKIYLKSPKHQDFKNVKENELISLNEDGESNNKNNEINKKLKKDGKRRKKISGAKPGSSKNGKNKIINIPRVKNSEEKFYMSLFRYVHYLEEIRSKENSDIIIGEMESFILNRIKSNFAEFDSYYNRAVELVKIKKENLKENRLKRSKAGKKIDKKIKIIHSSNTDYNYELSIPINSFINDVELFSNGQNTKIEEVEKIHFLNTLLNDGVAEQVNNTIEKNSIIFVPDNSDKENVYKWRIILTKSSKNIQAGFVYSKINNGKLIINSQSGVSMDKYILKEYRIPDENSSILRYIIIVFSFFSFIYLVIIFRRHYGKV